MTYFEGKNEFLPIKRAQGQKTLTLGPKKAHVRPFFSKIENCMINGSLRST